MSIVFRYDPALVERFPTIHAAVILARDLRNGPTSPALAQLYAAEQAAVKARLGDSALGDVETFVAWRRVFSGFGVAPTKYRSAAEALARRLTHKGDVPPLNHLVDLGNLISLRYGLPVAVFDRRAHTGTVTVRFATGTERFTDLGTDEVQYPDPGEVIFVDDTGLVCARRWCWRQSAQSAAREDTQAALITIEAHHASAQADIAAALADTLALLRDHVPGVRCESALLSAAQPEFSTADA